MNIEIVKKIVSLKNITIQELNEFVVDYIKEEKGSEPTSEQLLKIIELIKSGIFDVRYAANKMAQKLNLQITTISNTQTGQVLRIDVI